jgi:hypothetical protein
MSRPLADWCSWLDGQRRRWTAGGQRSLAPAQTKYEAGSLEDAFALLAVVEAGAVVSISSTGTVTVVRPPCAAPASLV